MATAGDDDDSTVEVWFCRHVGADLVGSAASVELDGKDSSVGSVRSILLKQIRQAAQTQYPRTVGKYESTELVVFHFGSLTPSNSNQRHISASAIPLNPGDDYDVHIHGGSKDLPIVFHIVPEPEGYPTTTATTVATTTETASKIAAPTRLPSQSADIVIIAEPKGYPSATAATMATTTTTTTTGVAQNITDPPRLPSRSRPMDAVHNIHSSCHSPTDDTAEQSRTLDASQRKRRKVDDMGAGTGGRQKE